MPSLPGAREVNLWGDLQDEVLQRKAAQYWGAGDVMYIVLENLQGAGSREQPGNPWDYKLSKIGIA